MSSLDRGEAYSLAEGPALANGNLVTLLNTESGGDVGGEVLVALLVTGVLGDVVEVLATDDQGSVHLGGNDGAGEDTATDGDETGEGALLVCTRTSAILFGKAFSQILSSSRALGGCNGLKSLLAGIVTFCLPTAPPRS
jgi:hypothetical protein